MSFLLWTVAALMGFALLPWAINSIPERRAFLFGALILALLIGAGLALFGIWQAVPATVICLTWLIALLFIDRLGSRNVNRPYSGALFALLVAIAIVPIYSAPMRDLPEPDGPYAVGMKEFVVTDATRPGVRGARADEPRKILVRAYYPADHVDGLTVRPYMSPTEYATMVEAGAAMGQPSFMDSYKQYVATNTYENAPVSTDGRFPVVIFSHGFTGPLAENLFIVENMVSRGHVVFMASHPGNTRALFYPDGTTRIIDESITRPMTEAFAAIMAGDAPVYETLDEYWDAGGPFQMADVPVFADSMVIWRDDMLAIANALFAEDLDTEIVPVWRAVDRTKLAYVGMSFGGSTAGISCQADPRCGLAIALDGNNMDPNLVNAQTRAPVVSIQAPLGEFPGTEGLKGIGIGGVNDLSFESIAQAGQSGLVTRVVVADTKHLSYTDNASFWRGPIRPLFLVGTLPADETNTAVNGLIGAALDEHFRGRSGALEDFVASNEHASTYSLDAVASWGTARGL